MGMYDYLGDEQVKVFSVPLVNISSHDENLENIKCHYGYSGGRLVGYGRRSSVPYKTLFYNYGENFIVFDYRGFVEENEDLQMHVVKNGKYSKSYAITEIPKSFIMSTVVDNYGRKLNIENTSEFLECHKESVASHILHQDLKKKYCEEAGIPWRLPHIDEFKAMSNEERDDFLKKYDDCSNRAFDESLKVFANKWISDEDFADPTYIGAIIHEMRCGSRPEWVWYPICKDYVKNIAIKDFSSLEVAIDKYIQWCKEYNVACTKEEVVAIFDKYLGEVPEDVVEAYKKTDYYERNVWWHKQNNK